MRKYFSKGYIYMTTFVLTSRLKQRGFHRLSNDEVYFRHLTYKTFRFPAQPLRQEGWKQLFKQIATARLFTWGAAGENRLGHSWPIRSYEDRGAKYPYEPKLDGVEGMVVDIAAGCVSYTTALVPVLALIVFV